MHALQDLIWLYSFPFMQRALLVGALVSISCALLGLFLVLKRFSLIGDGLAHVSFAAVALGMFIGTSSVLSTIAIVVIGSLLMLELSDRVKVYGDTTIGMVSTATLAFGIILVSISGGLGVDIMSYLFGSILLISRDDVILALLSSLLVIGVFALRYHAIFHVSYDEDFAALLGINPRRINQMMIVLTAITVAIGIRVVGTMLISSLLSLLALMMGLASSVLFEIPTGAAIVSAHVLVCLCSFMFASNARGASR